jgi:hypothetical protein
MKRPRSKALLGLAALSIAVLGLAPAGASAAMGTSRAPLCEMRPDLCTVRLTDPVGEKNNLVATLLTPAGGKQDLVIADTVAGIADPIPPDCARIDLTIIRCPANLYGGLSGSLGGGDDSFTLDIPPSEADRPFEPNFMDLIFGAGDDQLTVVVKNIAAEVKYALGPGNDTGVIRGQFIFSPADRKTGRAVSTAKRAAEVSGGAGRDRISGGNGAEVLKGGSGRDQLKGGQGSDKVFGGGGSDLMFGGPGVDFMFGNAGRDFIRGGGANDHGTGGAGDDNVKD